MVECHVESYICIYVFDQYYNQLTSKYRISCKHAANIVIVYTTGQFLMFLSTILAIAASTLQCGVALKTQVLKMWHTGMCEKCCLGGLALVLVGFLLVLSAMFNALSSSPKDWEYTSQIYNGQGIAFQPFLLALAVGTVLYTGSNSVSKEHLCMELLALWWLLLSTW